MKKTLSIILAILMIVTTIPMAFAADVVARGECGTNVTWALDSDGVLNISGEGAVESNPWKDYKDSIKTIVIEEGITELISWAFENYQAITEVFISSTVKKLGRCAFSGCTSLKEVVFTGDVTLEYSAFENCTSLKTVIFYSDVEFVSLYIFKGCTNLTEVIFYGDATLEQRAFENCTSLKTVIFYSDVEFVSTYIFQGCTNLTEVIFYGDATFENYTFDDCANLTEITFGGEVNFGGFYPFFSAGDLHSVNVHVCGTQENWEVISGKIGYRKCPVKNATPHYCEKTEKVDATCTEDGYTDSFKCNTCDYHKNSEVIPALNHKYTLVQVDAKAPTCYEIGWDTYEYCTACDYATPYVEKEALNHKDTLVQKDAKAPTCTEIGWDAYEYCTECDYTTYVEIPATNHKDTLVQVEAQAKTCTEIGWDAYEYCTACDYTTYAEIPASHEIKTVDKKDATCTEEGHEAYEYCTECDYTIYKEIPSNGHTPLEAVKENEVAPECEKAGSYDLVVYCDVCGEELDRDTVAVDALTHTDADGDCKCDHGCGHEFEKPVDPTPDVPDTPDEPTDDNCDHLCHKDGILGFFWKIISFLQRLFGIQQYCDCGVLHYDAPVFG